VPVQSVLSGECRKDTLSRTDFTLIGLLARVGFSDMLLNIVRAVEEAVATLPRTRILLRPITRIARRPWLRRWGERGVEQRRREIVALRRGCVDAVRHV
jgi:hypothetical protein